jgi:hypothetical protein
MTNERSEAWRIIFRQMRQIEMSLACKASSF